MYQLRTKQLDAAPRASFLQKLEAWGQEFGGDWVPVEADQALSSEDFVQTLPRPDAVLSVFDKTSTPLLTR